jgi:hypothetical protein
MMMMSRVMNSSTAGRLARLGTTMTTTQRISMATAARYNQASSSSSSSHFGGRAATEGVGGAAASTCGLGAYDALTVSMCQPPTTNAMSQQENTLAVPIFGSLGEVDDDGG